MVGLFVRLEAQSGKEEAVATFLRDSLGAVESEPATTAWFAVRIGPSTFGIFDAFPNESGRQEHLAGQVASALTAKASELFAQPPAIEKVDVIAAKLPQRNTRRDQSNDGGLHIPLQVGSELRITNNGEIIVDNPEVELAREIEAAEAVFSYRFNRKAGIHSLRLLDPVADYKHLLEHREND
jgi:quinol monooxygenase YgiN